MGHIFKQLLFTIMEGKGGGVVQITFPHKQLAAQSPDSPYNGTNDQSVAHSCRSDPLDCEGQCGRESVVYWLL